MIFMFLVHNISFMKVRSSVDSQFVGFCALCQADTKLRGKGGRWKSFCSLKPERCFFGRPLSASWVTWHTGHRVQGEDKGTSRDGNSQSQSEEELVMMQELGAPWLWWCF